MVTNNFETKPVAQKSYHSQKESKRVLKCPPNCQSHESDPCYRTLKIIPKKTYLENHRGLSGRPSIITHTPLPQKKPPKKPPTTTYESCQ